MALDKAIKHGKEKRKPYYGSKAIDRSCRNHGTCEWCKGNRLYQSRKDEARIKEERMTYEDAKDLIKRVRTRGANDGDYYMSFTDSSSPFNKDVDILEQALEKQIPKPKHKYNGYRCVCGEQVAKNQDYCEYCGQRLEVEE